MAPVTPTRRLPWVLTAAIAAKACWALWIGWHGLPHTTSDGPCFKQPAYMRLYTPNFSIPSYAGNSPYFDLVNSYPSAVYTYGNYLVFKLCGFSQFTSVAIDLTIHVLISALGAWALWLITGSQLAAIVFLLCSTQWLIPFGRPEEFGLLLVLTGLLTLERGPVGLATTVVALGMAGASSPGAAVVGTVLLVSFEALQRGIWNNRTRLLLLLLVPMLISAILYVGYVYPHLAEAFEQDRHMRETNFYYRISLLQLFSSSFLWSIVTFPLLIGAVGLAVVGLIWPPKWFPTHSTAGNFVIAAGIAVLLGLALNIAAQRPLYDYRHIIALAVAALAIAAAWLQSAGGARRYTAWGIAGLLLALSLPGQQMIARQSLGLLTLTDEDFDFAEAKALVDSVVPKHATVGGDGNAWAMIDDGRPFLLTRTAAPDNWPDYIISCTWANPPAIAQRPIDVTTLAEHYEELKLTPSLPSDGCHLNIAGLKVPLSSGRCDWYPRIWKRQSPSEIPSETRSGDEDAEPAARPDVVQ